MGGFLGAGHFRIQGEAVGILGRAERVGVQVGDGWFTGFGRCHAPIACRWSIESLVMLDSNFVLSQRLRRFCGPCGRQEGTRDGLSRQVGEKMRSLRRGGLWWRCLGGNLSKTLLRTAPYEGMQNHSNFATFETKVHIIGYPYRNRGYIP
jgi:hypothetical protein